MKSLSPGSRALVIGSNLVSLVVTSLVVLALWGRHDTSHSISELLLLNNSSPRLLQSSDCACSCSIQIYTCPEQELVSESLDGGGLVQFLVSDRLCTLVQLAPDGKSFKPVARSYEVNDWEASAGDFSHLSFDCSSAGVCSVALPPVSDGAVYQLTSFDMPSQYSLDDRTERARFLEQTTFGPTRAAIESLSGNFAEWIKTQQDVVPLTSHRAMYRRYLNARQGVATPQGAVVNPCHKGARYRRYAFSYSDRNGYMTIETVPGFNNKRMLKVNGFVRTVVDGPVHFRRNANTIFEDGTYEIRGQNPPSNSLGYRVRMAHPTAGIAAVEFGNVRGNPPIEFNSGVQPNALVQINSATPIDSKYFVGGNNEAVQEIILTQDLSDAVCASLGEPGNPLNPVFGFYNGKYWMHDPRYETVENTLDFPAVDGGGQAVRDTANIVRPEDAAFCANVPRTFLNQDTCKLSNHPAACTVSDQPYQDNLPNFYLQLTPTTLREIYEVTSSTGIENARYVYSIDGLRLEDDNTIEPPCQRRAFSRWISVPCTGDLADATVQGIFRTLLENSDDGNEFVRDVRKTLNPACPAAFASDFGFQIQATDGQCWLNVHPDLWNVYDFTVWTVDHPGNIPPSNPIKEVALSESTVLNFPDWHPMNRWQNNKARFGAAGKLYDWIHYYQLPSELRTFELSEHFGFTADSITYVPSENVVVCGSPNEVANDASLGGSILRGAFDSFTRFGRTTAADELARQKRKVWTKIALESQDQLRQRVAWALSQILVVSPDATNSGDRITEEFVAYYDIFVRRAFGNYRDILKEVAYSPVMAEMLTYWRSTSTAITFQRSGNVEFPDENFAREVMQLFTMGLVKLNEDGTEMLDDKGDTIRAYTNDDIVEYARVWTGFIGQPFRGNTESYRNNYIDPMAINMAFRDRFPKMGLGQTYVGDHTPLCADLPDKHFLKQGATFRLLGGTSSPELHLPDPDTWATATNAKRLSLAPNGANSLYAKLCGSEDLSSCNFDGKVVLDETIPCTGQECDVDTLRVVEVANGVFYEYVRSPCVYQAFFDNGKLAVRKTRPGDMSCADPRVPIASAACCSGATQEFNDVYWGERLSLETAYQRCGATNLCSRRQQNRPSCDESDPTVGSYCADDSHFWSNDACVVRAKINGEGKVAIVHTPLDYPQQTVNRFVQEDAVTFFGVEWSGGDLNYVIDDCDTFLTCVKSDDGMCICDVTVVDEQVFAGAMIPSREEVLSSLHIGAFDPQLSGMMAATGSSAHVTRYDIDGLITKESVFEITDYTGTVQFRKNLKSIVSVPGTDLSFRNPVHYISLTEAEPRDAHYETDEVINHYVTNENTAPFLATRLAQRFGISNASPRYVKAVATAFKTGIYRYEHTDGVATDFGTGIYGDLAATVACLLLDREARALILDADPSHGSIKEPLIKLISLMRSLEFSLLDRVFVDFATDIEEKTGQMAHAIPNVFSFFLAEYKPSGPLTQASLTAPEAQLLTGPRVVDSMNGILSLIKFGLTKCFGGHSVDKNYERPDCDSISPGGITDGSVGKFQYPPSNSALDELATLLTGGRLSEASRQLIDQVVAAEGDPTMKLLKAQQLMAFSPEFHSTNIPRRNGNVRQSPPPKTPSSKPYKAVVYVLLEGGMDSFNMLVPHTCEQKNPEGKTVLEQYYAERTTLAVTNAERSKVIDATDQPCSQFVVHQDLEAVHRLYTAGELAFFANTGVLNKPSNKDNYNTVTRTQLFAHNAMQFEAQRIDPFETSPGTGFLGRMCDVLNTNGFNAQPITIQDATVATVGVPGASSVGPLIVSPSGNSEFIPKPSSDTFDPRPYLDELNDETMLQSSLYGETWSRELQTALHDNEALRNALSSTQLLTNFPEDDQYVRQLKAVSTLIASHDERGVDRDVFFVAMRRWDHHNDMKMRLAANFQALNRALVAFETEMKAQGRWGEVTLVIASDFGRTLTANSGEGSDHAWGGNYFAMGGAVKGGQILGEYPDDITATSPLNVGRGRIIPTMAWESIFNGVLEWMDVPDDELDYCLPNRLETGAALLSKIDLFK